MSTISRKSFLGSLVAATVATTLGSNAEQHFKDINQNLHYDVKPFGKYSNMSGKIVIEKLMNCLYHNPTVMEGKDLWEIEIIEKETDNSIFICPSWLSKFYSIHAAEGNQTNG